MDAKVKPTWTYSRRLQKLITDLRYGNCNKKCKENLLNFVCTKKQFNLLEKHE